MFRRLAPMIVTAGAAMALVAAPAGAAVEPTSDFRVLACHNADAPTQSGSQIHGKGWGDCPQNVQVYVQWHRAWGWEVAGNSGTSYRGPGSAVATFNCSGVGHYTYRTLVQWRDGHGPKSAISPERRYAC